jgi:hypothetical protein
LLALTNQILFPQLIDEMDPFTITVGALTLAQITAKLVVVGHVYCKAVGGQREEVQGLIRELELLRGVLTMVKNILESDEKGTKESGGIDYLKQPFQECITQLERLHEVLAKQLSGATRLLRFGRKLKWPLKEGETKEWIAQVERYKNTFLLALQVNGM